MAAGEYCQTLDLTDVATTWTKTIAVRNKAQTRVFEALQKVRQNLPFPLLGLDSDNGSEFIKDELLRYCKQEQISFTRSHPYRKNDNCFVEQRTTRSCAARSAMPATIRRNNVSCSTSC
jgi:hypothetical protein